jgi:hypothetical protein
MGRPTYLSNHVSNPSAIVTWNIIHVAGLLGKLDVNFTLEQAMKAQRASRGIALLFL